MPRLVVDFFEEHPQRDVPFPAPCSYIFLPRQLSLLEYSVMSPVLATDLRPPCPRLLSPSGTGHIPRLCRCLGDCVLLKCLQRFVTESPAAGQVSRHPAVDVLEGSTRLTAHRYEMAVSCHVRGNFLCTGKLSFYRTGSPHLHRVLHRVLPSSFFISATCLGNIPCACGDIGFIPWLIMCLNFTPSRRVVSAAFRVLRDSAFATPAGDPRSPH